MFDKFKQVGNLMKMRSEAQKLQKELELIVKTVEKDGWKISVSGDQKIRYIKNENGEDMPKLVEAINEALKDVQKEAAKKMMEMGGGLGGLLGKM
jgi:DNA-binding protein YbaB